MNEVDVRLPKNPWTEWSDGYLLYGMLLVISGCWLLYAASTLALVSILVIRGITHTQS